jgi:pimeloyl-ACP methyl ester carboxylesterase
MKNWSSILGSIFIVLFTVISCKKTPNTVTNIPGKEVFVSVTSVGNYSAVQLQTFASSKGYSALLPLIKYDVSFYKLIYKTTYKGKQINASGLLAIPKNTPFIPALVSAQHGTIFTDADAPSNFPNAGTGYELLASAGFATIIPDYLGYGSSKSVVHPYYDIQYSGTAVVDMIRAAKYYLSIGKAINNKLFLIGYSEGGYVTMAAQKAIESGTTANLSLTAAAEGAGGYDLSVILAGLSTLKTYPDPSFLTLILNAYNTTYGWNRPLTDFFNQPYATNISQLLDGTHTYSQIIAGLSPSPSTLFNPVFYSNVLSPTGEATFKAALAANSFPNWYPKGPTRLYHGTADALVSYQTSQLIYNRFVASGSTNLTLIPITGGTHETTAAAMTLDAVQWFQTMSN